MAEYGFERVHDVATQGYIELPNWLDPWPSPFHKAVEVSGYGGHGVDLELLTHVWKGIPIFLVCYCVGFLCKRILFPRLGVALGISARNVKKQHKFANQMWLLLFYSLNTYFGYIVQRDRPWFGFPMSKDNMSGFFLDYPDQPDDLMETYCITGLAFYASEIFSLFVETRRSDFYEYILHHVSTVILIFWSYLGRDHNMMSYTIFIHDASDIALCLAKSAHYVNWQSLVNASFAVFAAGFVFFRFICLPQVLYTFYYLSPVIRKATVNFYVRVFMMTFVLQLLHVYWFYLILRMVFRLATGVKGDTRSDSDKDDSESAKKKQRKTA
mmetsp:Transcript_10248/g.11634  ORF Transcript_10248/g.11634 Transcript_10248/m.11634 type:complete len:326 (-) Transcript_10248:94-1071(-)